MEVACEMREEGLEMHPFAFRVHTHALGQSVQGWKVRKLILEDLLAHVAFCHLLKVVEGGRNWTSLGKASPQYPQIFNMIPESELDLLVVRTGDSVAARYEHKTLSTARNKIINM